jgi:uncharacterized metal-binding protein YceD (DUF177 family)
LALVEDELLLTLPFAPRCPEAQCPAAGTGLAAAGEAAGSASPFGALAGLKAAPGKKARR